MARSILGIVMVVALLLLALTASAAALKTKEEPKFPPGPGATDAPKADKDGAFSSKASACGACKAKAKMSCAFYHSCFCYATNAHFPIVGLPEPSDAENWHWACGNDGGSKYEQCFSEETLHSDKFGYKVDPNNKICA